MGYLNLHANTLDKSLNTLYGMLATIIDIILKL